MQSHQLRLTSHRPTAACWTPTATAAPPCTRAGIQMVPIARVNEAKEQHPAQSPAQSGAVAEAHRLPERGTSLNPRWRAMVPRCSSNRASSRASQVFAS
jgi:hypothetical protein